MTFPAAMRAAMVLIVSLSVTLSCAAVTGAETDFQAPGVRPGFAPPPESTYSASRGEDIRRVVQGQDRFELTGLRLKIHWDSPYDKAGTSLFIIRDCETVVLRDLHIIQDDPDYRASCSILVEDCGRVLVEDCTFSGTAANHLRLEGCADVTIRNVEVFGRDYGELGVRCGAGIFVNNGDDEPGKYPGFPTGVFSRHPRDLTSLRIEHCLLRDNLDQDKSRNLDGILIHSAGNGVVSRCRFVNWKAGDAALDVSHRRRDLDYTGKSCRVEGNEFIDCSFVKTVGASTPTNTIFWFNNRYRDTPLADYHSGWDNRHFHEDFIFTRRAFRFMALWGLTRARTIFRNCLFVLPDIHTLFHKGEAGNATDHLAVSTDANLYLVGSSPSWAGGKGASVSTWSGWRLLGNDRASKLVRLTGPWEGLANRRSVATTPIRMAPLTIERDFNGAVRAVPPSVGALEAPTSNR